MNKLIHKDMILNFKVVNCEKLSTEPHQSLTGFCKKSVT